MKDDETPSDEDQNRSGMPAEPTPGQAPLARLLPFEIPFDGILNCGGDCRYGTDLRWLAPVVPIGGRERPGQK